MKKKTTHCVLVRTASVLSYIEISCLLGVNTFQPVFFCLSVIFLSDFRADLVSAEIFMLQREFCLSFISVFVIRC